MTYTKTDEAVRKLTSEQYRVTQMNGTERPFTGEYHDNKVPGIYVDVVSGEPLFAVPDNLIPPPRAPSLTSPIAPGKDQELAGLPPPYEPHRGALRTWRTHLGDAFPDGPADRGGLAFLDQFRGTPVHSS